MPGDDDDRLPTDVAVEYGGAARSEALGPPGFVLLHARVRDRLPKAFVLERDDVVIGRDESATVRVDDSSVSRKHVRVRRRGDAWVLEDLGSRNGTLVDGARIRRPHTLEEHDQVRLGDVVLGFVEDGAERWLAPRARVRDDDDELVGGAQIEEIRSTIRIVAPTSLSCLVLGETGTGKELVARAIHRHSKRAGSFQAVNCAAIPANLIESELFGYKRGAFSGAEHDKRGLITLADRGTLFLDEIGDMPLAAQAKLLRVLQTREVFPLGATAAVGVDLRVVCATHRDLTALVAAGGFRGDLLARINEHAVDLPPLRHRKEDVHALAVHFANRHGGPGHDVSFSAMLALLHYDWPYNVRELESCMKRAVTLAGAATTVDVAHLPAAIDDAMRDYGLDEDDPRVVKARAAAQASAGTTLRKGRVPSAAQLRELFTRHEGNVAAVARELGRGRMQIHRWMKRHGIDPEAFRPRDR